MEKILLAGSNGVLIKSVAEAIPAYSMSCFKLPKGLYEHITSIIWDFWWGKQTRTEEAMVDILGHYDYSTIQAGPQFHGF